jgi:guanine deaminase
MNKTNKFLQIAINEANFGIQKNHGGPFGAVIVKRGRIISQAHNEVLKNNDPINHAEILAISRAAKKLNRFNLSDCEIYSTSEPCPMCLSAIFWAKIKKVYYGCGREDVVKIGFKNDKDIYDLFITGKNKRKITEKQINHAECLKVFQNWQNKKNKKLY